MDNAAKALQIAGAVLLAVILLSFIVYAFKQFGKMPESQDEQLTAEQLARFNQEYEVYRKSKMYGVDVISCLNKVQSFNDKYVLQVNDGQQTSGGFYVGTSKYGDEFKIDVLIAIGKQLSENVVVSKMNPYGKEVELGTGDPEKIEDTSKLKSVGFNISGKYTNLDPEMEVKELCKRKDDIGVITPAGGIPLLPDNEDLSNPTYCSLLYGKGTKQELIDKNNDIHASYANAKDNPLVQLLKYTDKYMRQIIPNKGNIVPVTQWSHITWETALYDFKKRRFTCEDILYDEETGRVDKIIFKEVK